MKQTYLGLAATALVLLASSCKEPGPTAGELNVNLTTPNTDDGAIQFTASANTPATITGLSSACSGCKLFVVKVNDNQYKGVLTGSLAAGTLFRLGVSDTKNTGSYSVTINAVASRTYATRNSVTGYSIALAP